MTWTSRAAVVVAGVLSVACGTTPTASRSTSSPTPDVAASATIAGTPTPATTAASTTCASTRQTPAQTEGPYFKAGSSERASLVEAGMAGTRLTLSGRVTTATCQPIAHVLLDFWQADSSGNYDNSGYRLRGHVFTDAAGNYRIETIIPGLYTGRTEHIHVKVQPPGGQVLTTQLYFPGVAQNDSDGNYNAALLLKITDSGGAKLGTYDFVVGA
jgi:protocatechuate 3,4-dioxygenase beta subunit